MNTQHTPGPWLVGGPYPSVSVCTQVAPHTADEPAHWEPLCFLDERTDGERNEQALADARLIAAAPELLEACDPDTLEAIAKEIDSFEHSARKDSLMVLARKQRAAIAKAMGLDTARNDMPLSHTNDTERAENPGDIRSPEDSR